MFMFNDTDEPIEFKYKRAADPILVPPRGHRKIEGKEAVRV